MGEPVETYLDAEEVAARAADLALAAERNRADIAGPTGRIRELNAAEPWGHDDVGNTFRASYLGTSTEDGDAVESVLAGGEEICDHVYALGEDAGVGAITTRLVDQQSGEEFARMLARVEENRPLLEQEAGPATGHSRFE